MRIAAHLHIFAVKVAHRLVPLLFVARRQTPGCGHQDDEKDEIAHGFTPVNAISPASANTDELGMVQYRFRRLRIVGAESVSDDPNTAAGHLHGRVR